MNQNLYATLFAAFEPALDEAFLVLPSPHGDTTLTYRQIDARSAAFAGALSTVGVQADDRVVVQIEKSSDAIALYLGCLRLGAVMVALNTAYTDGEVEFFVEDAAPKVVVRSPGRAGIGSGLQLDLGTDGTGSLALQADRAVAFTDIAERAGNDTAVMLYTSGTTGRSKGAMITHQGLASNGRALREIWGFKPGDVLLHALPVFHVHGLFVALHPTMLNASPAIFLPKFSADAVIEYMEQASIYMGVPTHYTRLMQSKAFTPDICSSMRLFTSGSAPMTELVHQEFEERSGHRILERYGMTETGIITSNPLDGDRVAGTVGFALPGFTVRVADEFGKALPANETGMVEMTGPGLFNGYWQLPEKTASEFRPDGFFITGDVGSMDSEGRLTLEGRSGDMIISGGLNVYPKEVEMALDELPEIVESAVVGLPHPDFGEAVVAFVVLAPGATFDMAASHAALSSELARFKLPKAVIPIDALPRNTMAKVQKKTLRTTWEQIFSESPLGK